MGGGSTEDQISVIWLSPASIENYNDIADAYNGFSLMAPSEPYSNFYSFSGAYVDLHDSSPKYIPKGTYAYTIGPGQNETPTKGLYSVSEGNVSEYNVVLKWLQSQQ